MLRIKSSRLFLLLLATVILLVPAGSALADETAPQDSGNLLANPGFESGDSDFIHHHGDIKVAASWDYFPLLSSGDFPTFYPGTNSTEPAVREGIGSQAIRWSSKAALAGVSQTVTVPQGSRLRLTVYAKGYACAQPCGPESNDDNWLGIQIGIDPSGGTSWGAGTVIRSGAGDNKDTWQQYTVEADATGPTATVFMIFEPTWPIFYNRVFFDEASLTTVGDAVGDTGSTTGTTTTTTGATVSFVSPQAPQADGSIVHTVGSGDTLSSIAVAYYNEGYTDITVPKIKELNNLVSDIIVPGQKLTIVQAGGATAPPADTSEDTSSEEETPAEEGTGGGEGASAEEEEASAEVATSDKGQICLSLFDDTNANLVQDIGEGLLAGGSLLIADTSGFEENYTTTGTSEPHCFSSLNPGEYTVSATVPAGFNMTTISSWSVQVDPGAQLELTFGAVGSGETAASTDAGAEGSEDGTEDENGGGNLGRILIGLSGLLVLAIAGGLGAYLLIFRRKSA